MTPRRIFFTDLELDPAELTDRLCHGVIPAAWQRYRFASLGSIGQLNRWLSDNIEGRWAIYAAHVNGTREITVAFEHGYDASLFVLNDGPASAEVED